MGQWDHRAPKPGDHGLQFAPKDDSAPQPWWPAEGRAVRPDRQQVELLGKNRLTGELLQAGLEVAQPIRDRGIDLIAYADVESAVASFVARPIQMKAASEAAFGLNQKYAKFPNLLIAYVWHVSGAEAAVTFALTYAQALEVVEQMGWTTTRSWRDDGNYVTSRPSPRLRDLLDAHRMTPERWWTRVTQGA